MLSAMEGVATPMWLRCVGLIVVNPTILNIPFPAAETVADRRQMYNSSYSDQPLPNRLVNNAAKPSRQMNENMTAKIVVNAVGSPCKFSIRAFLNPGCFRKAGISDGVNW
jgi:hypothetical protein